MHGAAYYSAAAMLIAPHEMRITAATDELCALLHAAPGELAGCECAKLCTGKALELVTSAVQQAAGGDFAASLELPVIFKGGPEVRVDIIAERYPADEKLVLVQVLDATCRRRAVEAIIELAAGTRDADPQLAEELQQQSARVHLHQGLFLAARFGIATIDGLTGTFQEVNPRFAGILGINKEQLLMMSVTDLPITCTEEMKDIVAMARAQGTVEMEDCIVEYADGSSRVVDVQFRALYDTRRFRIAMMLADVSERRMVREQLRLANEALQARGIELEQLNRRLQDASAAKSRFLADTSHEIRSPLNAVMGYAELLADAPEDELAEEYRSYGQGILEASQHLLQLVTDVIDISKIEAGKFVLNPERLSVKAVVEQVLPLIAAPSHERGVRITTEITDHELAVWADELRLKQVLWNLLSNAVKNSPPEATVRIGAAEDGSMTKITVTDEGFGIAPEHHERIFEEFFTIEHDDSPPGIGLGLAVTRRIVEAMGGTIEMESSPGHGSSFTITLPAASTSLDTDGA